MDNNIKLHQIANVNNAVNFKSKEAIAKNTLKSIEYELASIPAEVYRALAGVSIVTGATGALALTQVKGDYTYTDENGSRNYKTDDKGRTLLEIRKDTDGKPLKGILYHYKENNNDYTTTVEDYKDGKLAQVRFSNGLTKEFDDGKPISDELPNGVKATWENGIKTECYPNGIVRKYNGENIIYEYIPNVSKREWNLKNKTVTETLPGQEPIVRYTNGNKVSEIISVPTKCYPIGTELGYDYDGKIISITYPNGKQVELDADGKIHTEKNEKEGIYREFYSNGNLSMEKDDKKGTYKKYYSNGLPSLIRKNGEEDQYHYDDSWKLVKRIHINKDDTGYVQYQDYGRRKFFHRLVNSLPSYCTPDTTYSSADYQNIGPEIYTTDGGYDSRGNYYMLEKPIRRVEW